MSRALFLSLSEEQVIARCKTEKVSISALERLPAGGVRLVCTSSDGAAIMNRKLKTSLIADNAQRLPFRPLYERR